MPKEKFIRRGDSDHGYSSIGCTQQYLYAYFAGESRFLKTTAEEIKTKALRNIQGFTRTRIGWTAPSAEMFAHEETSLVKYQAYLWVSDLFHQFSLGENPHQDAFPIDFNEVFEHYDCLPKISGLLTLIRQGLQNDIYGLMKSGLTKKLADESVNDFNISLNEIKITLTKINLLREYEDSWNNLFILAVRGLGAPIFRKEEGDKEHRSPGLQII